MNLNRKKLGSLECVLLDALPAGTRPQLEVVLCHGVNAPGDDLVPLGAEILERNSKLAASVQFCFPAGLIDSAAYGMPGGRAWWEIDWGMFEKMMLTGDYSPLRKAAPPGLKAAREALQSMLDVLRAQTGLATNRMVLGGFSQGAMLATDLALHLSENVGALCLFSGTLINETQWRSLAGARKGMPVFQSHGRQDPLLPISNAEALRDLLIQAGLAVEFLPFNGQHGIPAEACTRLSNLLGKLSGAAS